MAKNSLVKRNSSAFITRTVKVKRTEIVRIKISGESEPTKTL